MSSVAVRTALLPLMLLTLCAVQCMAELPRGYSLTDPIAGTAAAAQSQCLVDTLACGVAMTT